MTESLGDLYLGRYLPLCATDASRSLSPKLPLKLALTLLTCRTDHQSLSFELVPQKAFSSLSFDMACLLRSPEMKKEMI